MVASVPTAPPTFLFTDIEGSTRLWEERPEAMRAALARHDRLVREAIEAHGGRVFKALGDGFCAAFAQAADAVRAALEAQRRMEGGRGGLTLRVRMALHSGDAEQREGDYFGPPLNRVARLLGIAHGGQVLLSQAASGLAGADLPAGALLRDLGPHRLKDLERAERVSQLIHPDLPSDFPVLPSLSTLPHNLPQQVTSFIGRGRELAQVKELLAGTRLLTLTGVGGTGKTRLALQAAAEFLVGDGDGVWLVELAPVSDPARVAQAVADVLQVREEQGRAVLDVLLGHLSEKRLLLILDNCEHLIEASARLADETVRRCPQVRLLATSREALGIAAEIVYQVPSLEMPPAPEPSVGRSHRVPATSAPGVMEQELLACESVQLFVERARRARPGFEPAGSQLAAVGEICRRLDGIPLALELAASRARAMSVEQIAERLDDRFRLLTRGSRTALPHHQTLQAAVDWSHDLLTEEERVLLRRLSVFMGGWTLEAAEQVCAGETIEEWEVLDLLTSLVDKSLAVFEESEEGEPRYRLLETVRHYARDHLVADGQAEKVIGRHRHCFLALAEEAYPQLLGPGQAEWTQRLERDHGNLRAALESCQADDAEMGLRLASALWWFWMIRGYWSEGRERLEAMLGASSTAPTRERAATLNGAGVLARLQGDFTPARDHHLECLRIQRELGDQRGIAGSLNNLGLVAWAQGDHRAAREHMEQALAINREIGNRAWEAGNLHNLGLIATVQGDYQTARECDEAALKIHRALGNRSEQAAVLTTLGTVARLQGDLKSALPLCEQALALQRELGHQLGIGEALLALGNVLVERGDPQQSQRVFQEGYALFHEMGSRLGLAEAALGLGGIACRRGDTDSARRLLLESLRNYHALGNVMGLVPVLESLARLSVQEGALEQAVRLWAAAAALREAAQIPRPPGERESYDRDLEAVRERLGAADFDRAWAEGTSMDQAAAVACARGGG